jgi:hypothetical protein
MQLRFPPRDEAPGYAEWVADLYEADAYYVSQARYVLGHTRVEVENETLEDLSRVFSDAVARGGFASDTTIEAYRTRLDSLKVLIQAMAEAPTMRGP